jgi:DNA-directed RNA polymerase subunit RPC12/RpoP
MGSEPSTTSYVCSVCGETASAAMTAECNWCNQRYHLNQRNDMPEAKDCGSVWIDDQFMALQFACGNCLAGGEAPNRLSQAANVPLKPAEGVRTVRARTYKRRV